MFDPMRVATETWRPRFDALIQSRMSAPFSWGWNDCCLFAADAALAITGVDHAADVRGTYSTEREAMRVLKRLGGVSSLASRGGDECLPLTARTGDVCLVMQGDREALAVCAGHVLLAPAATGLAAHQLTDALRAWRIHG